MSRIGKKPVAVPAGVTAKVDGQIVAVKGAEGRARASSSPTMSPSTLDGQRDQGRPAQRDQARPRAVGHVARAGATTSSSA